MILKMPHAELVDSLRGLGVLKLFGEDEYS